MKDIQFQAHMGVASECPENTMSAFRCAAAQGYDVIELDLGYTLDGVIVALHDDTLNRTARTSDGSRIKEPVYIKDITFAEAMQYDLGIHFSEKYRGERLPRFEDILELAVGSGIRLKIDNKIQRFPDRMLERLFSLIRGHESNVSVTSNEVGFIKRCLSALPELYVDYDGAVDEDVLTELSATVPKDKLTVWLPFECAATSWVKVSFADRERSELVKRYARLGVWIIKNVGDFARAVEIADPDIVETNGVIKPKKNVGKLYDMHTHSEHSHDSVCPVRDMAERVSFSGLDGFAVTDHCDIEFYDTQDLFGIVRASVADARENDGARGLEILRGIEIGEGIIHKDIADAVIGSADFDAVIGSVHAVEDADGVIPYSRIDFGTWDDAEIDRFLDRYFDAVLKTAETCNIDILAHLTCPLRYICGKYGFSVDVMRYGDKIRRIFECVIKRGIALEVNTSCLHDGSGYRQLMPSRELLGIYRSMGGYLLTVGSDAHVSSDAAEGFDEVFRILRSEGFENVFCFKNRIAVQCAI